MLYVLSVLVLLPLGWCMYLLVTSIYGFLKKEKTIEYHPPRNNFLCVVAARNEEAVIRELINSIRHQDYPKELYDIVVIINNSKDKTKDICLELGVNILEPDIPICSKGEALKWGFKKLETNGKVDVYAIFDADNLVDRCFLKEMNSAVEAGYDVCQGTRVAKNINDNFLTKCYDIYYLLNNLMFDTRRRFGGSSPINGTGYVIKKNYIDKYGYDPKTLTEDMELAGQTAIRNGKVGFVRNAIAYDEQPVKISDSWRQLKRWSAGNGQCAKLYTIRLLDSFVKHRKIYSIDMIILYCVNTFQVITVMEGIVLLVLMGMGVRYSQELCIILGLALFVMVIVCICVACWGILTASNRTIGKSLSGIVFFPIFLAMWSFASIAVLLEKKDNWVEIPHTRAVSIEDLVK